MNSVKINQCNKIFYNIPNNRISFKSDCKLPYGNVKAVLCKTDDDINGLVWLPLSDIYEKPINPLFIEERKRIFKYWKNHNKVLLHIVKFVDDFIDSLWNTHYPNEIAGTAVISPLNETLTQCKRGDIAYLSDLYLHPAIRGYGNGKAFVEHLKEDAKSLGYKKILLNVEKDNEIANKLYLKTGFKIINDNKTINDLKSESEYFNSNNFMIADL